LGYIELIASFTRRQTGHWKRLSKGISRSTGSFRETMPLDGACRKSRV